MYENFLKSKFGVCLDYPKKTILLAHPQSYTSNTSLNNKTKLTSNKKNPKYIRHYTSYKVKLFVMNCDHYFIWIYRTAKLTAVYSSYFVENTDCEENYQKEVLYEKWSFSHV